MASEKKYQRRKSGEPTIYEMRRAGKQAAFLAAIETGATVTDACRFAGVAHGSQQRWRKTDPKFAADFRTAFSVGTAQLAAEARRRAVEGFRKPYVQGGRVVTWLNPATGTVEPFTTTEYSDTLLMFLLKSRDPETYDDRVRAERIARKWAKKDAAGAGETTAAEAVVDMLAKIAAAKAAHA